MNDYLFNWRKDKNGGTEIVAKNVVNNILIDLPKFKDYNCFLLPGPQSLGNIFDSEKPLILWFHNHLEEFSVTVLALLNEPVVRSKLKYIVVVSETLKKSMLRILEIEEEKVIVIPNMIYQEPSFNPHKLEDINDINLMYISHPLRGLHILLNSLKYTDKDFSLNVFSDFDLDNEESENIIEAAKDPRITFYGRSPRKTLQKYFDKTQIFSYPAFYQETFCMAQVEAMSAGCLSVYGKIPDSAVAETSGPYGISLDLLSYDFETNSKNYAECIDKAIEIIKNKEFDPTNQINFIKENYGFEAAKKNWTNFHDML